MPTVGITLLQVQVLQLAQLRALTPPPARLTLSAQLAAIIAAHLDEARRRRHLLLLAELRQHPRRARAGLPLELQDLVLQAIHRGPLRDQLLAEFVRAGEWHHQISAIARRWRQAGIEQDELEAAGLVGLMRAVDGWRPGAGFRSYAYTWITKEIDRACRLCGNIVMESEHEVRIRRKVEKLQRQGLEPAEIAKAARLSPEQVERGMRGRRPLAWKDIDGRKM